MTVPLERYATGSVWAVRLSRVLRWSVHNWAALAIGLPLSGFAIHQCGVVRAAEEQVRACREAEGGKWPRDQGEDKYGRWAEFEIGGLRQRMRLLPAGTFMMGSPEDEEGRRDDEGPQHEVTLTRGLWLADSETTQVMWRIVTGKDPMGYPGDLLPVGSKTWDETQAFINRLNDRVPGLNARLPTEAEWEYAARAGATGARYGDLWEVAWHLSNAGDAPRGVKEKEPNAWGLYDMLGNMNEWTADFHSAYPSEAVTDPSARVGGGHVSRGGNFACFADSCRAAARTRRGAYGGSGFRIARDPEPEGASKAAPGGASGNRRTLVGNGTAAAADESD